LDLLEFKIYIGQYILAAILLADYDREQTACKNSGGSTVVLDALRHEKCAPAQRGSLHMVRMEGLPAPASLPASADQA
jgi:hypothetical protein